jgi:hypothetical protein
MMPSDRKQQPLVFIDDAHTFGGAQIALACGIRVILQTTEDSVVCVCTTRTRQAIQAIAGTEERLDFVECPSALPLNIISFPLRLIPFLRIVMRLRRTGVRAWWLNLSGIEFCIAPQMVLMALGETSHAWLHNTQSFAFFNGNSSRLRRWLSSIRDQIADRWLFGIYSWLITPSQSSALEMLARIRGTKRPKSGHLYCPTIGDLPTPNQNSEAEDCGSWGPIDIWMIGRIEYGHKNNLVALDVLEILHRAGKEAILTVLGEGPDLVDFKVQSSMRGVANRIRFLGWKTDPWKTVPRNALVFIPSFYESMSLVAREAMMRGIRLTVSPIPVFREWIPNHLIADSFSAQAFADKIFDIQSLKKKELLEIYSVALTKFSDAIFVKQFMEFTALK